VSQEVGDKMLEASPAINHSQSRTISTVLICARLHANNCNHD